MTEECENCNEKFVQDGVLLKSSTPAFINYINTVGTLFITEYTNLKQYIEWKPLDVTVDSDIQDQEWAVVNTVEKRMRTLSGSVPVEYQNRKYPRICFDDIKSFRVANKNRILTFNDGKSEIIASFMFQHGNCEYLVTQLKQLLKTAPSRRDKHLFVVLDINITETQQIDKSFAELNLYQDGSTLWRVVRSFQDRPVETTFEAFSKITDLVYKSPEQRDLDEDTREILNRSLTEYESTTQSQGDYEVIAKVPELPKLKDCPRSKPLTIDQWIGVQDKDGKIEDSEIVKLLIFQGGVSPELRSEVWKYLLDYYPWKSTLYDRQKLICAKNDEYFSMKLQWKTITKVQEDNFMDFRERKSQIEKDVNRTDRTVDFYAGDNNPNIQKLYDILMTYVMYNFDLGYVQGMSDLLSPILHLVKSEVDAFWCFVGFMNKVSSNFDIDQAGMKEQLSNLHTLLAFVDRDLANYFDRHDSGNMFFCFRWLLVWFKRELSEDDIMAFWEVLWTGFPCENFHLLVCVAILVMEKQVILENNYGFTEILKHINELSGKLDVEVILNRAQATFYQIKEAEHLTDSIRILLDLPIIGTINSLDSHETSPFEDSAEMMSNGTQPYCSVDNVRISPDEVSYDRSISSNFL